MTTDGAMHWPAARQLIEWLAKKLQKEWGREKGLFRAWIRIRLSLAIARATSACIRGNRCLPFRAQKELELEIGDGAAVAHMLDLGSTSRPDGAGGK